RNREGKGCLLLGRIQGGRVKKLGDSSKPGSPSLSSTPRHTSYLNNESSTNSICSTPPIDTHSAKTTAGSRNPYEILEDYGKNLEEDEVAATTSTPPIITPRKRHLLSANWYPDGRTAEAEKPLVIDVKFNGIIDGEVMIDSGCSTEYMDLETAKRNGFEIKKKPAPEEIEGFGGASSTSEYEARVHMIMDQHAETVVFHFVDLPNLPVLLGKSWLSKHNPDIDWTEHTVLFRSRHCLAYCLPKLYTSKPQRGKSTS